MQPYRLGISESDVQAMRERLARTRWPEQLPGTDDWSKGVPVAEARAWAQELAAFDWRALQDELNALPQWTTEIDGARIHFVHVRSQRDDAIPLIVLHGGRARWSSSSTSSSL